MKEYKFQYTKIWDTVAVILLCILLFMVLMFVGIYFSLQEFIIIILDLVLTIIFFKILKRKVVRNCIAKLNSASVDFEFERDSKIIEFSDLVSFKAYYGKNGPILYLKNNVDSFKISANNNFCKTENFQIFCNDIIDELDKYRNEQKPDLIHEGSVFATKGMLYFLIVGTSIYLFSFFIEEKALRMALTIGGGFYFFILWLKYIIVNKKQHG